ncbi:IS3 family transposase, partial [Bradyrhizobium sp. 145]|uniref:IS3 family transposase n=1 Tax=Bradyrhizobium sp. 145 TaxID=2782621 RepID=UPI001FF927D5
SPAAFILITSRTRRIASLSVGIQGPLRKAERVHPMGARRGLVTRATSSRNGGRHHFGTGGRLQIGMVGEIISESWATSIGIRTLRARPRRRRLPKDEGDRQVANVPANLLDRKFVAERPNQKWIAEFTYIWTAEGWLHVSAVIDLFSRRVVGWSMSASMTAQLVADARLMAVWRRGKPDALMHPSDHGSQYASEQFQRLMAESGIVCSMSRSGNVWDNAAMESFFSSLKTERTERRCVRLDRAVLQRHPAIGYLSPVEFERKVGLA